MRLAIRWVFASGAMDSTKEGIEGTRTSREAKGRRDAKSVTDGSGRRLGRSGMVNTRKKNCWRHCEKISGESLRKVDRGETTREMRRGKVRQDNLDSIGWNNDW
jgi:hypothetical protein